MRSLDNEGEQKIQELWKIKMSSLFRANYLSAISVHLMKFIELSTADAVMRLFYPDPQLLYELIMKISFTICLNF